MTKKCVLLSALLVLTIAAICGIITMMPPRSGVTEANFNRIQIGMNLAEVEELFGGPGWLKGRIDGEDYYSWTVPDGIWVHGVCVDVTVKDNCVVRRTWVYDGGP